MDTFDNNDFDCQPIEDPVTPPQPEQTTYHSTGSGRKESPYADSPYAAQSHQEYEYQPQRQPKPPKKSGGKTGRRILAAVLALVLVAGGCLITAASVNAHWEKRTRSMEQTMAQQIEDLQKQIAGVSAPSGSTVRPALPDGTSLTPGQALRPECQQCGGHHQHCGFQRFLWRL